MKKIFYSMFALFMALSFASCEDVPAPYADPSNPGDGEQMEEGIYLEEAFTVNKGKFEIKTVKGKDWRIDHNVMTASGYDFDSKATEETETYLVSPAFNLTKSQGAYISFKYINMYVTPEASFSVLISDKYTGQPETTEWKDLSIKWEESAIKDWDTYFNYDMNIPAEFIGKENIVIAFGFKCTSVKSCTFKIKDLIVKDGVVEENGGGDEPVNPDVDVLKPVNGKFIGETFGSSFGVFSVSHVTGTPWIIDFHTAKASGYDNQTKETTASESYLVSKPMDMTNTKEASINFEYLLKYVTFNDVPVEGVKNEVLVTDNFTGDPATTQWTVLGGELKEYKDKDWNTFFKYDTDIPAQFMGKGKVVVALHYACAEKSGTWEVKNLNVVEGKAGQGGGDEPGDSDTPDVGDTTTPNGDFETWVGGEPNNWNGPASKANLFQSTDAHSGSFSVQVGGSTDGNMRLGYKILNLKAGHYVMKFFVKAVTAEGGSARPGFVVLTDGKPTGGNDYKYGDYVNDLKQDTWTEATYEFDITADGEYTVVVMNAKKPGKDILVDDVTLECNGEFIIK